MQVILLERVENLGQMGDTVKVRPGYGRNYLLPQKKALRATKENVAYFETQKSQLEANNLKKKSEAENMASRMQGVSLTLVRQASDSGQLYGSIRPYDIQEALKTQGYNVERNQIVMSGVIKEVGTHDVRIRLHAEVDVTIKVSIAKSEDEAQSLLDSALKGEEEASKAADEAQDNQKATAAE